MNADVLTDYLRQIEESERKEEQKKKNFENLKNEIKIREKESNRLSIDFNIIKRDFEKISSKDMPQSIVDFRDYEIHNKILRQHIQTYEQKNLDLNQKMFEIIENRRKTIQKLNEESLSYYDNYGAKGLVLKHCRQLSERLPILQKEKNDLKNKCETFEEKLTEVEDMESRVNWFNRQIIDLKSKQTFLQKENSEWNPIETNRRIKLKELKNSESKEMIQLREDLKSIEEMEKKLVLKLMTPSPFTPSPLITRDSPLKQTNASKDFSEDKNKCETQEIPTPQEVPLKHKRKRPQNTWNVTQEKRVTVKVTKIDKIDDRKLWELIRQRGFRRKSKN